ncbi:hypothetical protein AN216_02060 [Streptomyces oceani]|uniref:Uncharacterized protein n=1 Tax=Streptomyces oceani TaxID=1075402 RepID=A0A1E7KPE1_9ACTN|nr:hypothetical protein AN216_02060 [Streptomyces oceani]
MTEAAGPTPGDHFYGWAVIVPPAPRLGGRQPLIRRLDSAAAPRGLAGLTVALLTHAFLAVVHAEGYLSCPYPTG